LGAPLSTILIMVELTGDLAFAVAVMVAVVLATVLYRRVQHYSFFTDVLARRGVRIAGGHDVGLLREQRVGDLMVVQPEWVGRNMTVEELRRRVWTAPLAALVVTPEGDGPAGLLTVADLAAAGDGEMAGDLCHPLVVVEQDDHLERAILVAEESEEEVLGVAGRQPGSIAGLIRSVDLARAYGRLLRHLRAEEHGERPDLRH
ncbi:MAG: CBS domain-containing protein, partial [Alphaproteobacteria bacterium]